MTAAREPVAAISRHLLKSSLIKIETRRAGRAGQARLMKRTSLASPARLARSNQDFYVTGRRGFTPAHRRL